jgi:hypothetical protein
MARLLQRGHRYEVLHSVCDRDGYDIVIEAKGIIRHIQLKTIVEGGKRGDIDLPVALRIKPSGCAVIMGWNPKQIQPTSFRFFGGLPGQRLPDLGNKVTTNSRGKGLRHEHRNIGIGKFIRLADLEMLIDRLFGAEPLQEREMLVAHMATIQTAPQEPWASDVRVGAFAAIPDDLTWEGAGGLAGLIDGYALIKQLGHPQRDSFLAAQCKAAQETGRWPGSAGDLWITLFLEHRRQHFDGEPLDSQYEALLDRLVQQLREALIA